MKSTHRTHYEYSPTAGRLIRTVAHDGKTTSFDSLVSIEPWRDPDDPKYIAPQTPIDPSDPSVFECSTVTFYPLGHSRCPTCDGTGSLDRRHPLHVNPFANSTPCPTCEGTGHVDTAKEDDDDNRVERIYL